MADAIWDMLQLHSPELSEFYRDIWGAFPQKRLLLTSAISVRGVYCSIIDIGGERGVSPHIPERRTTPFTS